jgi:hypothetical protein
MISKRAQMSWTTTSAYPAYRTTELTTMINRLLPRKENITINIYTSACNLLKVCERIIKTYYFYTFFTFTGAEPWATISDSAWFSITDCYVSVLWKQ